MNKYAIEIDKQVIKYMQKQHRDQQERLLKAIYRIPEGDIKKMKGYQSRYRLRIGDYRIVYEIIEERLIVLVLAVGSRGDVYK